MLNIIIPIISLFFLIILIILKPKLKRKYRKLISKVIYIFIIIFLSSTLNTGLKYYLNHNIINDNVPTLEANISKLETNINQTQALITEYTNNNAHLDKQLLNDYINKKNTLINNLNQTQTTLTTLTNTEAKLKKEYDTLYQETSSLLDNIPTYHQYPDYPNGCESVALYLLLKYYQVDVEVEDIVETLKKGSAPFYQNGVLYAGNPIREFVGDPRLYTGYGVYEKPIMEVANTFKKGIINYTGASLNDVLAKVKSGHPVQVWVSINLKDTKVCMSWLDEDTNEKVDWICDLHSVLVVGYDYKTVIVSDPYTGEIEYYDRTQFNKMYDLFGKRALYYEE